jgi:asparagine synthase (glutamine-hydrolysing)
MPARLWQWVEQKTGRYPNDIFDYTAIRRDCLTVRDLSRIARQRKLDFTYRPWKDGFAMRVWVLTGTDLGNYNKGSLGGWGIDRRDPLADKRLVEYCLGIPTDEFIANGLPRALARRAFSDRLPPAIANARKRGYQGADWHERLTAARGEVAAELDRLAACAPAAKALDIDRLKRLVENWPKSGWEREDVMKPYRLALLRGISAGHFLRKTTGSNR